MQAITVAHRFRFPLQILIFVLGLWPFWEPWVGLSTKSSWLTFSAGLARQGWLGFQAATLVLLVIAIVLTAMGALLRLGGAAYTGAGVARAPRTIAETFLADGPYRRTRNPLYLGTLLHTAGVALLMPPAGAVFAIAAIWILQVRLALTEENFLETRLGQPYRDYMERVPRFLASPRPLVPVAGIKPRWTQALVREIYFVGVVLTLLVFGWSFNATPLFQGMLISLGVAIVLRALLPTAAPSLPALDS